MKFFNLLFIVFVFLSVFWTKIRIVKGIHGGNIVQVEKYKYMVSVQTNNQHICGGGILTGRYILSAAHCFIDEKDKFKQNKYTVLAGVTHLLLNIPSGITEDVNIIYVPQEFKGSNSEDENVLFVNTGDIAVLQLKGLLPISNNPSLMPLKLPQKVHGRYLMYYNQKSIITGYGIDYDPNFPDGDNNVNSIYEMKYAESTVLHRTVCKSYFYHPVNDKHLCSRITQHQNNVPEGTCRGDDGGPLVFKDDTVIGVLMKGNRDCNEKNGPSLYTRVSSFITFINNAMLYNRQRDIRVAVYVKKNIGDQTIENNVEEEELVELDPRT